MSKIWNKIKSLPRIIRNYTPRKLAAVLLGVAAIAVPVAIFAATPLYTWSSPSPLVIFASIVDNPHWPSGTEQSFTKIIDQSGNPVIGVSNVQNGQVYTVEMLAHNDAAENLNLYSTNTRAAIGQNLHADAATSQTLMGVLAADNVGMTSLHNAGAFGEFTSTVQFNSSSKFTLQYVPGSARYQSGFSGSDYTSSPAYTFNLSDDIVNKGVSIGNETGDRVFANAINGQIYGCWPNHGLVTAQYKIVMPSTPTPAYNLTKTVDKTSAKPGDTLNYTLIFNNTGDTDLTNVAIKDQLPSMVALTGKVNATVTNGGTVANLDNLFTSGADVSVVHAGGKVVITFSAKVNDNIIDTTNCKGGTATIVNTSSATSTEDQTETNPNDNSATTTVTVDSICSPSFDIIKSVDKTTAQAGDTLAYTLTFKNTGNEPLTNIALTDTLPAGVTLVPNSLTISDKLTYTGDLFANKMVVAGPIAKGASFTITYKVTINKDITLVCGDNKLTNVIKGSTNEVPAEPDTSNNSATTNVPKDCTPSPVKPCPTNPSLNYNDANCASATPTTVAATGPTEVVAGLLAAGALTFGLVAYINSRRTLKANSKK